MIVTIQKSWEEKQVNMPSHLLPILEELQELRALNMQMWDMLKPTTPSPEVTLPPIDTPTE